MDSSVDVLALSSSSDELLPPPEMEVKDFLTEPSFNFVPIVPTEYGPQCLVDIEDVEDAMKQIPPGTTQKCVTDMLELPLLFEEAGLCYSTEFKGGKIALETGELKDPHLENPICVTWFPNPINISERDVGHLFDGQTIYTKDEENFNVRKRQINMLVMSMPFVVLFKTLGACLFNYDGQMPEFMQGRKFVLAALKLLGLPIANASRSVLKQLFISSGFLLEAPRVIRKVRILVILLLMFSKAQIAHASNFTESPANAAGNATQIALFQNTYGQWFLNLWSFTISIPIWVFHATMNLTFEQVLRTAILAVIYIVITLGFVCYFYLAFLFAKFWYYTILWRRVLKPIFLQLKTLRLYYYGRVITNEPQLVVIDRIVSLTPNTVTFEGPTGRFQVPAGVLADFKRMWKNHSLESPKANSLPLKSSLGPFNCVQMLIECDGNFLPNGGGIRVKLCGVDYLCTTWHLIDRDVIWVQNKASSRANFTFSKEDCIVLNDIDLIFIPMPSKVANLFPVVDVAEFPFRQKNASLVSTMGPIDGVFHTAVGECLSPSGFVLNYSATTFPGWCGFPVTSANRVVALHNIGAHDFNSGIYLFPIVNALNKRRKEDSEDVLTKALKTALRADLHDGDYSTTVVNRGSYVEMLVRIGDTAFVMDEDDFAAFRGVTARGFKGMTAQKIESLVRDRELLNDYVRDREDIFMNELQDVQVMDQDAYSQWIYDQVNSGSGLAIFAEDFDEGRPIAKQIAGKARPSLRLESTFKHTNFICFCGSDEKEHKCANPVNILALPRMTSSKLRELYRQWKGVHKSVDFTDVDTKKAREGPSFPSAAKMPVPALVGVPAFGSVLPSGLLAQHAPYSSHGLNATPVFGSAMPSSEPTPAVIPPVLPSSLPSSTTELAALSKTVGELVEKLKHAALEKPAVESKRAETQDSKVPVATQPASGEKKKSKRKKKKTSQATSDGKSESSGSNTKSQHDQPSTEKKQFNLVRGECREVTVMPVTAEMKPQEWREDRLNPKLRFLQIKDLLHSCVIVYHWDQEKKEVLTKRVYDLIRKELQLAPSKSSGALAGPSTPVQTGGSASQVAPQSGAKLQ